LHQEELRRAAAHSATPKLPDPTWRDGVHPSGQAEVLDQQQAELLEVNLPLLEALPRDADQAVLWAMNAGVRADVQA
jgi:hypothetical protein